MQNLTVRIDRNATQMQLNAIFNNLQQRVHSHTMHSDASLQCTCSLFNIQAASPSTPRTMSCSCNGNNVARWGRQAVLLRCTGGRCRMPPTKSRAGPGPFIKFRNANCASQLPSTVENFRIWNASPLATPRTPTSSSSSSLGTTESPRMASCASPASSSSACPIGCSKLQVQFLWVGCRGLVSSAAGEQHTIWWCVREVFFLKAAVTICLVAYEFAFCVVLWHGLLS